jgi:hypothetical protein
MTHELIDQYLHIIVLSHGLLKIGKDELFELNVITFCCRNSFYRCNNNTNKFEEYLEPKKIICIWLVIMANGNQNVCIIRVEFKHFNFYLCD